MTDTPDQVDALDKVLLGHSNWVDSQHIYSNNGSYRLSTAEAKARLTALLLDARITELNQQLLLTGHSALTRRNLHDRIRELKKQRGGTGE